MKEFLKRQGLEGEKVFIKIGSDNYIRRSLLPRFWIEFTNTPNNDTQIFDLNSQLVIMKMTIEE